MYQFNKNLLIMLMLVFEIVPGFVKGSHTCIWFYNLEESNYNFICK